MRFAGCSFLLFAVCLMARLATAADDSEKSLPAQSSSLTAGTGQLSTADLPAFSGNWDENNPYGVWRVRPRNRQAITSGGESRNLADLNGDICYTMRSYKVRPSERLRDDEPAARGYSTCEMASGYDFRSAEAHPVPAPEKRK